MADPADEALMGAVARGDTAAFETLCRRWERPLLRFLVRQAGPTDAEDLFQETWMRVVRAAAAFDPQRRFSTWLFQIALNLCRDRARRPAPEPVDPSALDATAAAPPPDAAAAIDARRLLQALPEAQRAAVVLRYWHDLPEDDVATILDIPRGTVKSRLHQAMRRLLAVARGRA
ncbi:MAG: sigma-70 family RNA polymerase sigma factor [bacterium]|nr:sigma-70 family RNA polymerase sigma factor [bacterium]